MILSDHVVSSGTPPWSPRCPRRAVVHRGRRAVPLLARYRVLVALGCVLRWCLCVGVFGVCLCLCLCGVFVFYCVFELVFVC